MSSKDEILIKITPKQDKFVKALINGMSQRQAYKFAYDAKNMKDTTIDSKACILIKKENVNKYYNKLISEANKEIINNISNINQNLINKIKK